MENCYEKYGYNMNDMQMPNYNYGMPYMDNMTQMPMNMCSKFMNSCYTEPHMMHMCGHRGGYGGYKVEPLENMCGNTYNFFMMYVDKTVNKIVMENMGMMPKAISKEKFNKEVNEMLCEVMREEDKLKKMLINKRNEVDVEETTDRGVCPYCNSLLKDTLGILFITKLLRGGCTGCF